MLPYLFAIYKERLSHIIMDKVEVSYGKLMHARRVVGLQIFHLLFVDDLLLFFEASIEQAYCMYCLVTFANPHVEN